jgi:hypothetical protein
MHPILIAGAALVGLPIILHLILKQEPKRLVFPALRFLKMKQKTSERKMRLRHLLLLALRCLLIALFAVTLYQPTILSTGTINLAGEQPVAAVLILDTSPSMGYKAGGAGPSRLDEARRRALEFLDDLPKNSRVAVVDPNDPIATWEPTLLEARTRIEGLKEPAGYAPPVTSALVTAYQLLKSVDQEAGDQTEPLPRLVAVFSDRTSACWDASRIDELKKLRDAIPTPAPVQIFFDVGDKAPTNGTIVSVALNPQRVSGSADITITAVVRADGVTGDGGKLDVELAATLDGTPLPEQLVSLVPGRPTVAPIRIPIADAKIGFHTVEVRLKREDGLAFDNVRTLTFEVAAKRKILTISDDPDTATAWQLAHDARQEFDCIVATPDQVPDFTGYEAVTLLGVKAPAALSERLQRYVEGGGKLMLIPDGPDSDDTRATAYNDTLETLLPAKLGKLVTWELNQDVKRPTGVPWKLDDDADLRHPLLAPFREWKRLGNVDVFDPKRRRLAVRYREIDDLRNAAVVAYFDDHDDPKKRHPALLERIVSTGTVLLLTTRFDAAASDPKAFWNDYAEINHSWAVLFPWTVMRYLCGSPDDAAYTFATGQDVTVPLPRFEPGQARKIIVEGPGIAPRDAVVELGERQIDLRITPPKTLSAGVYSLRPVDEKNPWRYQFSLNTVIDESVLEKVPEETIVDLFGKNSVAAVDKAVNFRELIDTKFDQPFELFPILLLLVLLFFAFEGFVANRFYKLK